MNENVKKIKFMFDKLGMAGFEKMPLHERSAKRTQAMTAIKVEMENLGVTIDEVEAYAAGYDCCSKPIVKKIKQQSGFTTADGSRHSTASVKWCASCGSLYIGDSVSKPSREDE